jgi:hemoglobin-like flavoprotein
MKMPSAGCFGSRLKQSGMRWSVSGFGWSELVPVHLAAVPWDAPRIPSARHNILVPSHIWVRSPAMWIAIALATALHSDRNRPEAPPEHLLDREARELRREVEEDAVLSASVTTKCPLRSVLTLIPQLVSTAQGTQIEGSPRGTGNREQKMLTEDDKAVIRETWRLVVPIADTAADLFYKRLFELEPSYRALFTGDLTAQKKKFLSMLAFIVKGLDWPESAWRETVAEEDDLFLVVLALGRRHSDLYKIPEKSYGVAAEALLWTLDYGLGKKFDDAARKAWTEVYTLVATAMKMGRFSVQPRVETDRIIRRIVEPTAKTARGSVS